MPHAAAFLCLMLFALAATAQPDACLSPAKKHSITSAHLGGNRAFWVGLPVGYDTAKAYPVIYVLDAEWRFGLASHILYDLGGNDKIPRHIVVGIPHVDWKLQRGVDMTFSHSRVEYDGEAVDSTWYNPANSGGGEKFYRHLVSELVPAVDKAYPTNGQNTLVGHSYGGYFCSYIMPRAHPFTAFQIYDPSIWYGGGEALGQISGRLHKAAAFNVYIAHQPVPDYHAHKVGELIALLQKYPNIRLGHRSFAQETHNSLFLGSLLAGMAHLYPGWHPTK